MTLEQLADAPADVLEKLKDDELLAIFKSYFPTCRPEMIVRKAKKVVMEEQVYISPQKRAALALLEERGVDLSFMKRKIRK